MRITAAYYRMRFDRSLWALRLANGVITAAVGPLPDSAMEKPPVAHPLPDVPIDVSAWDVAAFTQVSAEMQMIQQRRMPSLARKVDVHEDANGFSIRLA